MNKNQKIGVIAGISVGIVGAFFLISVISFAQNLNNGYSSSSTVDTEEQNRRHQILLDTCEEKKLQVQKAFGLQQALPNDCESIVQLAEDANN